MRRLDSPQRRQPHTLRAALILLASLAFAPAIGRATTQPPQHPTSDQDTREASGHLIVIVKDGQGGRLPGATVVFSSPGADAGGGPRVLVTDASGEATLDVPPGDYRLVVELPGFEPATVEASVRPSETAEAVATLSIGGYAEQVAVRAQPETFVPPTADGQVETLSPKEIEQLPDDLDELALAIEALAGVGAEIRVNGFEGGALPPKNQIQVVRIRKDPFSTDSMGAGQVRVEIITRPGGSTWTHEVSAGLRDQSLDARPPFSQVHPDGRTRRLNWSFSGPIVRQRSSMSGRLSVRDGYDAQPIIATGAPTEVPSLANTEHSRFDAELRVEHAINATQTLRGEYQRWDSRGDNLGVGEFELPERAFSDDSIGDIARISAIGTIGRHLLNEVRLEYVDIRNSVDSVSNAVGINVPNAFRSGGAQRAGGRRDQEIEIAQTVDLISHPKHKVRFGFETELGWTRTDRIDNYVGVFTFSSLADYEAGTPQQFSRRTGNPLVTYDRQEFSWFAYDEVEMREGLRFGFGFRHDIQSLLDDANNIAPRASLSWTPKERPKTTVTAGVGLFNEWYQPWVYEQSLQLDGTHLRDVIIRDPGYPNPLDGQGAEALPPPSIIRESAADLDMTYTARASVGVEHRFSQQLRVQLNVYGQSAQDRLRSLNANAPVAGVFPDPEFERITEIESTGRARSAGFDSSVRLARQDGKASGLVRYQYAQAWNDSDGPTTLPADSRDLDAEWGPASWDVRHRVFGFVRMELPMGLRANAWGDLASGAPYTVRTGLDDNSDTVFTDRPEGLGRNTERGTWQRTLNLRLGWRPELLDGGSASDGATPGPKPSPRGVEFYAQAWNILNETNFSRYAGVMTSPYFLQPTAAAPARRFDFGTRVFF
ncbi:hypothetical protein LuPra_00056 [Luteitalea pratensis]|uniref:TonB-dependent transporter Oar-like beta-barrel domain-containing protein n=1 Tax=Luteitalea pratensis TaxID=1855912 RepID=A0A143PEF0_LUTPR|nr:TonB-dependent receptor [Luteitalea pratensis]AMY06895.1 hypothetical protein LuPra_00056 [Luteitalea pratensis]